MSHLFGFRDFMPNRESILEHDLKSKERCVMPSRLASSRLASPRLTSPCLGLFKYFYETGRSGACNSSLIVCIAVITVCCDSALDGL